MSKYMEKDVFLSYLGLSGDETKYGNRDEEHQHRSYSTYMSYEIIDSVVDSLVEEDLVPVVHGCWEIIEDDYGNELMRCPVCKSEFYDGDNDTVDHMHNYCPNCGAKMDGDKDGKEE